MDPQPLQHSATVISSAQIRSRITVVCAECKRLKLKCDRRTPCGSCVKRDTVPRCTYSAAAAEKIDVQSLHNRVLLLEGQLAQLVSGKVRVNQGSGLDRALVATSGGSSVLVPLDDVAAVWLEQLDLSFDLDLQPTETSTVSSRPVIDLFPNQALFQISEYEAGVTPALIKLLPPDNMRDALIAQLEQVMRLHPSMNFAHFRWRISSMLSGSADVKQERPALTYFALAAAGFALGAQSWLESAGSTKPPRNYDPEALLLLSKNALSVYEATTTTFDSDYLSALLLHIVFYLHDGKPRLSHVLLPTLGKMVNVARMMGLNLDPDDSPGKFTLFESETRRRIWWDIFYYDVFISDFMGQVPLIPDNIVTCNLPSEVDEEVLNPRSISLPPPNEHSVAANNTYFILKCRLAQLIKNLKKRTFSDPKQPTSTEMSLDQALTFENGVLDWLKELHPDYKIELDGESPSHSTPPFLVAQRCELATAAHSIIIKIYNPFLQKSYTGQSHHAQLASVNSAHAIIHASRHVQSALKGSRPAAFLSYIFNRQLFQATIIAANAVILGPSTVYASVAMDDVRHGVAIMRDPAVPTSRGPISGGVEGSISEPLAIVEKMLHKAEEALRGTSAVNAGLKRKHSDGDDNLRAGFQLPFAGPGVVTSNANNMSPPPPPSASTSQASSTRVKYNSESSRPHAPRSDGNAPTSSLRVATPRERKHQHHPQIGVRVRANTASKADSPSARREAGNSRTNGSLPPPLPHASQSPQTHSAPGAPFARSGPSAGAGSGPQPMDEYVPFDDGHLSRYASAFPGASSPHPSHPPMFDPSTFPPPPPGYYGTYATSSAPSQPYEASMAVHPPQHLPLMLTLAPTASRMDTTSSHTQTPQHAVPGTPNNQQFPPIPEKGHAHFASSAQDADGGSGHESSDSGFVSNAMSAPTPRWPAAADEDPRYQAWQPYEHHY